MPVGPKDFGFERSGRSNWVWDVDGIADKVDEFRNNHVALLKQSSIQVFSRTKDEEGLASRSSFRAGPCHASANSPRQRKRDRCAG